MQQECKDALFVLHNLENASWQIAYKSAIRLDNCNECNHKYDREIMAGLEYSLGHGLRLNKYPDDTLLAYRHLLVKYMKYGNSYNKKIRSILDEIANQSHIPEWYWYFRVRYAFISEKRLLNRKIKNLKDGLESYYLEEGQRPKNLNKKFDTFIKSVETKTVDEIGDDLFDDVQLASKLKLIFQDHGGARRVEANISTFNVPSEFKHENRILFVGACKVPRSDILELIKQEGLDPNSFDMILNYEEAKKFDFESLKHSRKYQAVLLGPTPHNVMGVNGYDNIGQRMRVESGFPPVINLRKDRGISKTRIQTALSKLRKKLK